MSFSILDAIGNTPLIEIRRLNPNPNVTILAKLEYLNPGGSIKDRPALFMIEEGEKSGELTPEKTVIEATSGNTGIGLALVCAVKGYKLLLAMSESASLERRKILKARGADILLTPGHLGTDGAIEEVYRLARENPGQYFMADQFNNPANWKAHYYGTAEEIWKQTEGKVNMVIATMGTTGTLMGISKRIKEYSSDVKIIGVEPYLGHKLQGLKNMKEAYCPEIYDKTLFDEKINIDDEEAFEMTRQLAREEGLFVGMSSGAAMAIAQKKAGELESGKIVVVFPDGGERYLSTSLFTVRETVNMKLFNPLTKKKEPLEPILPGKISMYTSGPTASGRLHPGEYRRFVFSDLIHRYLSYRGYEVRHIVNITDLDDNTIEGSEKANMDLAEFTQKYIDLFLNDLSLLGVTPAEKYPRTSEHLEDMLRMTESLVKKGYAYEKLRSVYFNISRFPEYGNLSGIDLDKIRVGSTVDLDDYEKENPRDFTLFKRSRLSELKRGIFIKTKWGNARPSWHVQGAAIAQKFFGETWDIHAGAREFVFPHHENEIAIAKALSGKQPVKNWILCDRVLVEGKKMDADKGGMTIDRLLDLGYSPKTIRYWLLSNHYGKPITFSTDRLDQAARALNRFQNFLETLKEVTGGKPYPERDQLLYDIKNGFTTALDDDLNISAAMASLFSIVRKVNILLSEGKIDQDTAEKIIEAFQNIDAVLGIFHFEDKKENRKVAELVEKREKARADKNWEVADAVREQLQKMGFCVRDKKNKT